MKYRPRVTVVEAYQWGCGDPKPDWLLIAINDGRVYGQGGNEPYYTIEADNLRVNAGDWFIYEGDKRITRCKQANFAQRYEADE